MAANKFPYFSTPSTSKIPVVEAPSCLHPKLRYTSPSPDSFNTPSMPKPTLNAASEPCRDGVIPAKNPNSARKRGSSPTPCESPGFGVLMSISEIKSMYLRSIATFGR